MAFSDIAEIEGDPAELLVYEHGWQSWSPAGCYPASATSPRPRRPTWQVMAFRPQAPAPPEGFQGEGLLAVVAADGGARLFVAPEPTRAVPSIRARAAGDRVVICADRPVAERSAPAGLAAGLARWAEQVAAVVAPRAPRPLGPGWCSWYGYWGEVTEADVLANLASLDRLGLDVAIVQVDDGHQGEIGDWLARLPTFGPLAELGARIRATGREPGLWTAPFLVGARSGLASEHPDWLVGGEPAAQQHWNQRVDVLDVTHPEAAAHLVEVYRTLAEAGFSYHKLDFLYAGAMPGRRHGDADPVAAYREGIRLVSDALGPEATLLGCGAPLLPSLGLFDAMRVSPDVDPAWEPPEGDVSQPAMRSAIRAGRARAWQHGRWWTNDPDCLLAREAVAERGRWAAHLEAVGGIAVSGDPLDALDARGLELTRRLLKPADPQPIAPHRLAPLLKPFAELQDEPSL